MLTVKAKMDCLSTMGKCSIMGQGRPGRCNLQRLTGFGGTLDAIELTGADCSRAAITTIPRPFKRLGAGK